jgi:two-component system CheB/CheR fusion protein
MPYRTFDDRIDGLVITFINLSDLKQVEVKLHETEQMSRSLLNLSSDVIIKISNKGEIEEFNSEAEKFFGKKYEAALKQNFVQIFIHEKSRKKAEKDISNLLKNMADSKIKMQVIATGGKMPVVEWSASVLLNNQKKPAGVLLLLKKQSYE